MLDKLGVGFEEALVMDPCCGAGTFLHFIEDHYAQPPEMVGIELDEAASAVASKLLVNCRVQHADSLDNGEFDAGGKPLVVIGNPPYSGHSSNPGKISELVAEYRAGLDERNPKWLQDDYVKFIRMAEHRVAEAGRGVVGFITNHSFLYNPTFRVMREHLMRTFDEIYLLDLHGNAKLRRPGDENGRDESIFPIQMGVAISLLVKTSNRNACRVRYSSLQGSRDDKLANLAQMDVSTTEWHDAPAENRFTSFVPGGFDLAEEYERFASMSDLFSESCVGFVTSRDGFAVGFEKDTLLQRISALRDLQIDPDEIRRRYPVGDLDIEEARRVLTADKNWEKKAVEVLYRPFDRRWAYLSKSVMERPRLPFMEGISRENPALAVGRAGAATGSDVWDVVFCTDCPADLNLFRRGGARLFPRYIRANGTRQSNTRLRSYDPDELFNYVYAILHSGIYRTRYHSFLMMDYPRIPVPDYDPLFCDLSRLGADLMRVHLMRNCGDETAAPPDAHLWIGGYNVPGKYMDDRRNRGLTTEEEKHVSQIKAALERTQVICARIDQLIDDQPPWNS